MFMREWLFEYKTDFFERSKIETVTNSQDSFRDKIFSRWNIAIKLEHGVEYPFENVNNPKGQAEKILKYKQQFLPTTPGDKWVPITDEKMSIIAEALSEVVKEYMDKKTSEEEDNDY